MKLHGATLGTKRMEMARYTGKAEDIRKMMGIKTVQNNARGADGVNILRKMANGSRANHT